MISAQTRSAFAAQEKLFRRAIQVRGRLFPRDKRQTRLRGDRARDEPLGPSHDQPMSAGASRRMLRAVLLSIIALLSILMPAAAGPLLGDDAATCRERQSDLKVRLDACERVIAAGHAAPKDIAIAFAVRGDGFAQKRDYDNAIAAFNSALEADPENMRIVNGRGWAYERKGQDDLAMADYNRALQKHPNFALAYNNRGTLFLRKGALQSALDDFNAALKYAPTMYFAHANRGRVLTLNKEFDAALADFAEAIRIDGNAPLAFTLRCLAYVQMRRFDDAIADCNTVIGKVPNAQLAICGRAEAYMGKGDFDAALRDLNAVLALNPNNVRAHMDRGKLFERRRDLAQARADYRSAAFALSTFDELDVAMARKAAQERLAALTAQGPGAASTGRRIALVIGNGAYRNVPPLGNPPNDVKLIAAALRDVGFQAVTVANDLTRDKFFEVLRAFASEAENADWAVVYYAGHGFEIGGVNYLVPIDARLAVDKDAETEAVALEQMLAAVGGARRLRLVMLDACRNNPFAPTMQRTMALKLVDKGFSNIEPATGFMVVYAAKHGETALDGESVNSPFATVLARVLKEPRVEVRKLFDIVRDDVWNETRHEQQPFTYGSPPGREDFYFVAGR
jgi:tetratricopeptide (TPR) repeat protein